MGYTDYQHQKLKRDYHYRSNKLQKIREHFERLYAVDQFLEKLKLPNPIQLKIDTLNGLVSVNEIEFVIEFFSQRNSRPSVLY